MFDSAKYETVMRNNLSVSVCDIQIKRPLNNNHNQRTDYQTRKRNELPDNKQSRSPQWLAINMGSYNYGEYTKIHFGE